MRPHCICFTVCSARALAGKKSTCSQFRQHLHHRRLQNIFDVAWLGPSSPDLALSKHLVFVRSTRRPEFESCREHLVFVTSTRWPEFESRREHLVFVIDLFQKKSPLVVRNLTFCTSLLLSVVISHSSVSAPSPDPRSVLYLPCSSLAFSCSLDCSPSVLAYQQWIWRRHECASLAHAIRMADCHRLSTVCTTAL